MNSEVTVAANEIRDMYDSLALAKSDVKLKLYSRHWDVFGEPFLAKLQDADDLYNFRRSGLSRWLDDSNVETDAKKISNYYSSLIKIVGLDFFKKVAESTVGNPPTIDIGGERVDFNDLFLVFYANQIRPFIPENDAIIVDIGGGYGGLGVKVKKLFPKATVVFLDLPEVNAIQSHYVRRNFPEARILTYGEYKNCNIKLDKSTLSSYDFAVLPGWLAEECANDFVDVVINTRSMMEMDAEVIRFYFDHIQRMLSINGFFYCVNRYEKSTVGYPIRIKDYPYDDRWYVVISSPSWNQPAIHAFGCVRTAHSVVNSAKVTLKQLKPFTHKDGLNHIRTAGRIVGTMVRERLRKMAIVKFLVKITGYQKYRETSRI